MAPEGGSGAKYWYWGALVPTPPTITCLIRALHYIVYMKYDWYKWVLVSHSCQTLLSLSLRHLGGWSSGVDAPPSHLLVCTSRDDIKYMGVGLIIACQPHPFPPPSSILGHSNKMLCFWLSGFFNSDAGGRVIIIIIIIIMVGVACETKIRNFRLRSQGLQLE